MHRRMVAGTLIASLLLLYMLAIAVFSNHAEARYLPVSLLMLLYMLATAVFSNHAEAMYLPVCPRVRVCTTS